MNVQKRNEALIYCLSAGTTLPEWMGDKARRNLSKRDESIRRRIDLIQDFQMPSSSTKLLQSKDGRYIMAAGTYPPRMRCYDTSELTMKFERYLNSHVIDMAMLGEDYGKMAILMDDRTVAFHAHYGAHDAVRIPTFGRAMDYESTTCELLLAAKGNQLYRLNLEEGRFSEPWTFEPSKSSATCIAVSQTHALAAVGCDDGLVRFWDNRSPDSLLKPILSLDVQSATSGYGYADEAWLQNPGEITSITHDSSGLYMAAGTASGVVALYDVRTSRPLHVMEHKHGTGIHTIKFHSASGCILSSDEKLVKIWRYRSSGDSMQTAGTTEKTGSTLGSILANVEGNGKLANFIVAGDEADPTGNKSGLLVCATDQPKMDSYYIPSLGLAPKWCSFLENITEELEERDLTGEKVGNGGTDLIQDGKESIYENYKFVSRDEVDKLGISNLVGTPLLRGYMHGFFMDTNLYNRVRAVANPFEYEEYRKKKLKERLDAKRASRIAPKDSSSKRSKKSAVNAEFALRLEDKAGDRTKAGKAADQVLTDSRFGSLFTNPDFHIDEEDHNFKLRNPSGIAASKRRRNDLDSDHEDSDEEEYGTEPEQEPVGFTRIHGGDDKSQPDAESENDSDSDEDGFAGGKVRSEMYEQVKSLSRKTKQKKLKPKSKKKATMTMYEAADLDDAGKDGVEMGLGGTLAVDGRVKRRNKEMKMSLEDRIKLKATESSMMSEAKIVSEKGEGASREVSYVPLDERRKIEKAKAKAEEERNSLRGQKRRGIKELKLKTPFKNKMKI